MNLKLVRDTFTNHSTIGKLFADDKFICHVLEDVTRATNVKVKGETAIPYGKYKIIIDYSNRFKKDMPHILDVRMFEGIRIHAGNTKADTEGCPLTGTTRGKDSVGGSRLAYSKFLAVLKRGLKEGDVYIDVVKSSTDVLV